MGLLAHQALAARCYVSIWREEHTSALFTGMPPRLSAGQRANFRGFLRRDARNSKTLGCSAGARHKAFGCGKRSCLRKKWPMWSPPTNVTWRAVVCVSALLFIKYWLKSRCGNGQADVRGCHSKLFFCFLACRQ